MQGRLTARCNDITPNVERHKVRPQVLHQVVHCRFAGVVDEAVRVPRQSAHAADGHDLAARLARGPALVAFGEEFEECHAGCENGCDVCFQRRGPEAGGPVVEVVVADFGGGGFGGWFGPGVGRAVEGCLARVVD